MIDYAITFGNTNWSRHDQDMHKLARELEAILRSSGAMRTVGASLFYCRTDDGRRWVALLPRELLRKYWANHDEAVRRTVLGPWPGPSEARAALECAIATARMMTSQIDASAFAIGA